MCAAISKITVPVEITVRLSDPETVVKALAVKAVTEQRYLLTVAYAPNLPDIGVARDGHIDFASKEVVEEACFSFARKGLKVGLWHKAGTSDQHPAEVVENYVYRNPIPWILKATDGTEQTIYEGTWLVGSILSPQAWQMYKDGLIGGMSPQGPAARRTPSADALAELRSR